MDYQVILSPKAVNDLEKIVSYISINNPEAAKKIGQQLLKIFTFPALASCDGKK